MIRHPMVGARMRQARAIRLRLSSGFSCIDRASYHRKDNGTRGNHVSTAGARAGWLFWKSQR